MRSNASNSCTDLPEALAIFFTARFGAKVRRFRPGTRSGKAASAVDAPVAAWPTSLYGCPVVVLRRRPEPPVAGPLELDLGGIARGCYDPHGSIVLGVNG